MQNLQSSMKIARELRTYYCAIEREREKKNSALSLMKYRRTIILGMRDIESSLRLFAIYVTWKDFSFNFERRKSRCRSSDLAFNCATRYNCDCNPRDSEREVRSREI